MLESSAGPRGSIVYSGWFGDELALKQLRGDCRYVTEYFPDELTRGDSYAQLVHPDDRTRIASQRADALKQGNPYQLLYRIVTPSKRMRWISELGSGTDTGEGRWQVHGVLTDVTDKKREDEALSGHKRALEHLARGDTLEQVLETLVRTAEQIIPGMCCSVLLLDHSNRTLRDAAAPSLPTWYREQVDGLPIGPKIGSCGAAAFGGKRVIVPDILDHPNWAPFYEMAKSLGLRACWSEPIVLDGRVEGTFAMYHEEVCHPKGAELDLIGSYAQIAGIAVKHQRAHDAVVGRTKELGREVELRTREIEHMERDLVEAAHRSGMAEVASDTIHTIGNILNSLSTSVDLAVRDASVPGGKGLRRLAEVLASGDEAVQQYLAEDGRAAKLANFLNALAGKYDDREAALRTELQQIRDCTDKINDVVVSQRDYARAQTKVETVFVEKAVSDTLKMLQAQTQSHNIRVDTVFEATGPIRVRSKAKLMNVISWLVSNAIEAIAQRDPEAPSLEVRVEMVGKSQVRLVLVDNGIGLEAGVAQRLFEGGYTTKADRAAGFHLHLAQVFMAEMKGSINLDSVGVGQGSTVTLVFPVATVEGDREVPWRAGDGQASTRMAF